MRGRRGREGVRHVKTEEGRGGNISKDRKQTSVKLGEKRGSKWTPEPRLGEAVVRS